MNPIDLSLYLVTDRKTAPIDIFLHTIYEATLGGVSVIQLREKSISEKYFFELGLEVQKITRQLNVPLIINDNLEAAKKLDAEGIHLGQTDVSVKTARSILGKHAIIGLSVETMDQVKQANSEAIDYIALSPIFLTPTKPEADKPFGIEGISQAKTITKYSMVAIGGMNTSNINQVLQAGANGIAVVSAIFDAVDPRLAAAHLSQIIKNHNEDKNTRTYWRTKIN